jgi:hypothetical protein
MIPHLLVERRGNIAIITFNRPEKRNAVDANRKLTRGGAAPTVSLFLAPQLTPPRQGQNTIPSQGRVRCHFEPLELLGSKTHTAFFLKCVCYLIAKCAPIDRDKYEYLPLLSPTCWQSSIISNGLQTWIANFKSLRREFGTPPKKQRAPAPMKSIRCES